MPTIPYTVLCADLSHACATVSHDTSGRSALAVPVFKLVPDAAVVHGQQVPLVCAQQLAASSDTAAVVAADESTGLAHCYKLVSTPAATAASKLVNSVCSSTRITLQGLTNVAATPSKWQNIVTRVSTAQASPQLQLQPAFTAPPLSSAWHDHQVAGAFTAVAVLLDAAQPGTPQHTQQLQQLQHVLASACPAAAQAGGSTWPASSTATRTADALQLLSAAAAGLLAASASQGAAWQAACASIPEPILCSSTLYGALCATLQQQQQQQQQQQGPVVTSASKAGGVSSPALHPAALVLAATSGGQVWLCDPQLTVQQSQQAATVQQQQQQQMLQPVKLLLDLQQPVVDIVPVSCDTGTPGLLLVGSLGRLVLLQIQQQQAQAQAQQQQGPAKLTAGQQLQLPFQVAAAAVVASADTSQAGKPPQQQQQQQQEQQQQFSSAQPLLLLLSASGRLYAASLASLADGASPAAAAAAVASAPGLLPLQPVNIPLPAAVSRFWTVAQQASPNSSSGSVKSSTAHPHAGSSSAVAPRAGQAHNSIVTQLGNSAELLEVSVQDLLVVVAAEGAAAHQVSADAAAGAGSSTAGAEAAREARQQLEQRLAALETLAAAKQRLEAAAGQQEAYLQGMQRDMDLLGLLQQQYGAAGAQGQQQQQTGAAVAGAGASSSVGKVQPLRCNIQLHGLWPILTAAGASSPSSGIHLALSVQLQQASSSHMGAGGAAGSGSGDTNSRGFTGRLGPGWQLVVSFVPESADSSSMQTTVDLSSSSSSSTDGSIHASLMLPLPDGCQALQEGGWVMVYAVKQPMGPAAAAAPTAAPGPSSWQRQQQHVHGQAHAGAPAQQGLLPVVTLLGQQYVSVLQLSALAAANPAVQPLVKASGAVQMQQGGTGPVGNGSRSSAPPTYSCMLQLSAVTAGAASDAASAEPAAAGAHAGAKRPRHSEATEPAAPQAQQQQRTGSAAVQASAQADKQQPAAGDSESGVLALQEWLSRALCLSTGPTAAPPLPLHAHGQPGGSQPSRFSNSSMLSSSVLASGGSLQQGPGGNAGSSAVVRQGQALFALGGGDVARAAWGFSTGQETPSMQLLDAAAGAVTAGMKRTAGSAAAGDGEGESSSGGCATLSVQLQASKVLTLASMHRAVLLEMLQQLEQGSGVDSSSTGSSADGSDSSRPGSRGQGQAWHMVSTVPQLKLAASRLRQLHQHLLKLQGKVQQAQDLLMALKPLAVHGAAAGPVTETWPVAAGMHTGAAAEAAASGGPDGAVDDAAAVTDLSVLLQQLEQGLCAGYGRFLLAVSDAVQLEVVVP